MNEPLHEMTDSERIAARIGQNRAIDARVGQRGSTPVRLLREPSESRKETWQDRAGTLEIRNVEMDPVKQGNNRSVFRWRSPT
jgi:hypothetical protein